MPIYRQSYRNFEGRMLHRNRWLIVLEQEWRVLNSSKIFLALMILALIHIALRFIQITLFDVVMQDPNHPLTPFLNRVEFIVVNENMLIEFIRLQTPLMYLLLLYAGSGMICNDFRNNLMEVYFSKPITWLDFAVGKVLALITVGLSVTALPGVLFVVLHNALVPSLDLLQKSWWWIPSIVLFSVVMVVPASLAILASSALLRSQGHAAITIIMISVVNGIFGPLLAGLLRESNYLIIWFLMAQGHLGELLFKRNFNLWTLHWGWSLAYVVGICLLCAAIVFRRIKRAEAAMV